MNPLDLDNQLNALIVQGKNIEAFQTFYDENVVAQENDEPERRGRDQWMRSFAELAKNIEGGSARVIANAANGDVSFSEWENDFVIKGVGHACAAPWRSELIATIREIIAAHPASR